MTMRGFKAFDKNLTCKGFQYEIGHTYEFDGEPIPYKQGFHFCKSITECYNCYPMTNDTRICVIEAVGEIKTNDNEKYCTNKIKIVHEITNDWERKGNSSSNNSGYRNSGNHNSGNHNSGNRNSGIFNSGNYNSGDYNSGYRNSGIFNSGNHNSGNHNSGYRNSGNHNSGNRNSGIFNSGNCNSGNYNSGYRNSGNHNSGDYNSGNCNSGNCNSGNRNSGDYNSGNHNNGIFNTETSELKFFDKLCSWTYEQWFFSDAKRLLNKMSCNIIEWVDENDMTCEEKKQHLEYETIGGYLKELDKAECAQAWWDSLDEDEKQIIKELPNFDENKFAEILGIKIR